MQTKKLSREDAIKKINEIVILSSELKACLKEIETARINIYNSQNRLEMLVNSGTLKKYVEYDQFYEAIHRVNGIIAEESIFKLDIYEMFNSVSKLLEAFVKEHPEVTDNISINVTDKGIDVIEKDNKMQSMGHEIEKSVANAFEYINDQLTRNDELGELKSNDKSEKGGYEEN